MARREVKRQPTIATAANETATQEATADEQFSLPVFFAANELGEGKPNWVQLSPFGKFPNAVGTQVFTKDDADNICNEFKSLPSLGVRMFGIPLYVGHPDHPSFKDTYTDHGAKGRFKDLCVRHDASCPRCQAFAANDGPACESHGLFGNLKCNRHGQELVANEEYHGLSVNWRMRKVNGEWHPFSLKSVGLTNEPGIPVPAVTSANEKKEKNMSDKSNGLPADNQSGNKPKKGLLQYISELLKKPELAKEGANSDDAVEPMQAYAANAEKASADLAAEKEAHAATKVKHAAMATMCNSMMKAYGANEKGELPEAVTKRAGEGRTLTADNIVEFAANEIPVLTASVAEKETALTAANEKISKLEAAAANQRAETDKSVLDLLIVGGFVTGAERKDFEAKLAANETHDATFKSLFALKPKLNVVAGKDNLGHVSSEIVAANQKLERISRITAVNEAVENDMEEQRKNGVKNPDFAKTFNKVLKAHPELVKNNDEHITR